MADILEKVRKLIALSGSANENEARTAATLACRLIRENKLELRNPNAQAPWKNPYEQTVEVQVPQSWTSNAKPGIDGHWTPVRIPIQTIVPCGVCQGTVTNAWAYIAPKGMHVCTKCSCLFGLPDLNAKGRRWGNLDGSPKLDEPEAGQTYQAHKGVNPKIVKCSRCKGHIEVGGNVALIRDQRVTVVFCESCYVDFRRQPVEVRNTVIVVADVQL